MNNSLFDSKLTETSDINLKIEYLLQLDTNSLKNIYSKLKANIQISELNSYQIAAANHPYTENPLDSEYKPLPNTPINTSQQATNHPIQKENISIHNPSIMDTTKVPIVLDGHRKQPPGNTYIPSFCAFCKCAIVSKTNLTKQQIYKDLAYTCTDCEQAIYKANLLAEPKTQKSSFRAQEHPDCSACGHSLEKNYLNTLCDRYHTSHLVCYKCNIPLYNLGSCYRDPKNSKKFYCQRDYLLKFAPNCYKCKLQITQDDMITSLGQTYHATCFTCSVCNNIFGNDVCYEYNGEPLCERHWHAKNKTICKICDGVIKDKCIIIDNVKYHYDCLI
ncbi:hypothetical protein BB561_000044 [Smittium simulii]|uniref:LIM zinc-binding domain-containing protein n=1 Tax=Smittium simulii TaxID=133385 RepID=A0A2T9Z0U8_9FUNG|nr:hypothetical protein BB561_000044 [Smittium simulii]